MQKKVVELLKQWRLEVEDAEIALGLCEETEEEKAERKAKDDSERGRDSGWLEACEIFVQNLEKILLEDIVEKNS